MFLFACWTIFILLFHPQILGSKYLNDVRDTDDGWGLFLSVSQGNEQFPSYDIGRWTEQLHLQQCAFVEIGEEFCALFVELRSIPSVDKRIHDGSEVGEFFLGLCKCATVRSWILCSDQLMRRRKSDCVFTEAVPSANTSARVHRRLCDVSLLTKYAEPCNCSVPMANQQLYQTEGFPTCFRTPLPESICSPRGICGVARCCATTIKGIHSPRCDPKCHEQQPFCEELGPWTSVPPEITSLWSHWSTPVCRNSDGRIFSTTTAICRNQITGQPAIDCIGPGSFCCPEDVERCTCVVTNEDGILKAIRMVESTLCIIDLEKDGARNLRKVHSKHQGINDQKQRYQDPDYAYRDLSGEHMEHRSLSEREDPTSRFRRRLMFSSYDYSEDRVRTFGRGAEFKDSDKVAVNDEIDDGNGDEDDEDEDEDEEEEADIDADVDADADVDVGADDDGELAENDEDDAYNTESSEFQDYVRRVRDPNMKKTGFKWTDERPPRFVRSNPSMCALHPKREKDSDPAGNTEDKCDEPEGGSGLEGPLQYSDYETDESLGKQGKGTGEEGNDDISSQALVKRILTPHPFWHLSTYICIALCT